MSDLREVSLIGGPTDVKAQVSDTVETLTIPFDENGFFGLRTGGVRWFEFQRAWPSTFTHTGRIFREEQDPTYVV